MRVQPGNCFAPFHWNDEFGENLAVNAVTSEAVDPVSFQPEFNFSVVSLTKASGKSLEKFTPRQQDCPQVFLAEFRARNTRRSPIPATAPFTPSQQACLNELLAQIDTGGR